MLMLSFDSTSRRRQLGQVADTICRSSEISPAQPALGPGSGPGRPSWLTFVKHPLAVVHSGRPNWARYTARSASALGLSNASTIATVWPAPPPAGSAYADTRSAGPYPLGATCGASTPLPPWTSVRASAKQDSSLFFADPLHRARTEAALLPPPGGSACAGVDTARPSPAVVTAATSTVSRRSRSGIRVI